MSDKEPKPIPDSAVFRLDALARTVAECEQHHSFSRKTAGDKEPQPLRITGSHWNATVKKLADANMIPDSTMFRLDALARTVAECPPQSFRALDVALDVALAFATKASITGDSMPRPPAGFVTVKQAAFVADVSERTIRRWLKDGDLRRIDIGGRVFVNLLKAKELREYRKHELN